MARKVTEEVTASLYERLYDCAVSTTDNLKRSKKDTDQGWMQKLVDAIDGVDEERWAALDADCKTWFNAAVAASQAEKPIAYPAGFEPLDEDDEEEVAPKKAAIRKRSAGDELAEQVTKRAVRKAAVPQDDDEEEEAAPRKKAAAKKAAAAPAKKAAAAPAKKAAAAPAKKSGGGAVDTIQAYVVRHEDASNAEVAKHLERKGVTTAMSTISVTRGAVLQALRHARAAGLIPE